MQKTNAILSILVSIFSATALGYSSEWALSDQRWLSSEAREEINIRCKHASEILSRTRYPDIPDVSQLHLPERDPIPLVNPASATPGLCSPILEEARDLGVFDDYKQLSDLRQKNLSLKNWNLEVERIRTLSERQCLNRKNCNDDKEKRKIFLKNYIESVYSSNCELAYFVDPLTFPVWGIHLDEATNKAFRYVEDHWYRLVKINPITTDSTLLLSPYPFLIPAGRFKEAYYWDSYFGLEGILATKRYELGRMIAENILFNIRRFGFVPNGQRSYYLSRSQAPFSSLIVRRVTEESLREFQIAGQKEKILFLKKWVREKALPLLARELNDFWMNPQTRFHEQTGLHHHWDDLNIKRPERHSSDNEAGLGKSYRDVRAVAESGLDFTNTFSGESGKNEITSIASVLLNTMVYNYMKDLVWLAEFVSDLDSQKKFSRMVAIKKAAINQYLWSPEDGFYQAYHLSLKKRIRVLSATTFVPMFTELSSGEQARKIMVATKPLWKKGGIASSELWDSPHQWDGTNGWAPFQMMAAKGMLNFGFKKEAKDLAQRWTTTLTKVYQQHNGFFERVDVISQDLPKENHDKYPVQEGFLWTNASFVWMLTEVLEQKFYSPPPERIQTIAIQ